MSSTDLTAKRCSKCKATKLLRAFRRDRNAKDGRRSTCRACDARTQRRYVAKFGEQIPERKVCPSCDRDLPSSAYYKNKGKHDGLQFECKDCFRSRRRDGRRTEEKKWCPGCCSNLPTRLFIASDHEKDGLAPMCQPCTWERNRNEKAKLIERDMKRARLLEDDLILKPRHRRSGPSRSARLGRTP